MRQKIKEIMANILGIEVADIEETQDLREDLGMEAQAMTELLQSIEEEMGMEIPPAMARGAETVGDFLDSVEDLTHEL